MAVCVCVRDCICSCSLHKYMCVFCVFFYEMFGLGGGVYHDYKLHWALLGVE